jgi:hypothetical protein
VTSRDVPEPEAAGSLNRFTPVPNRGYFILFYFNRWGCASPRASRTGCSRRPSAARRSPPRRRAAHRFVRSSTSASSTRTTVEPPLYPCPYRSALLQSHPPPPYAGDGSATCEDSEGSFSCTCGPGFTPASAPDGRPGCADVDEYAPSQRKDPAPRPTPSPYRCPLPYPQAPTYRVQMCRWSRLPRERDVPEPPWRLPVHVPGALRRRRAPRARRLRVSARVRSVRFCRGPPRCEKSTGAASGAGSRTSARTGRTRARPRRSASCRLPSGACRLRPPPPSPFPLPPVLTGHVSSLLPY